MVQRVNNELYICRYELTNTDRKPRIGFVLDKGNNFREGLVIGDLSRDLGSRHGIHTVSQLAEADDPIGTVRKLALTTSPVLVPAGSCIKFLSCVDDQEGEAAGVTYKRSQVARADESGSDIYQRVADDVRPEIFGKAQSGRRAVNPGDPLAIRHDSMWNVPEPELTIVFNSRGQILGYTVGNDMSSRDIEGRNPLYLPQAKVYDGSCGVGSFMRIGVSEDKIKEEAVIRLEIYRGGKPAINPLEGRVSDIQRTFQYLRDYLFNSRTFEKGVFLLTGTNVVPEMRDVHPDTKIEGVEVPGKGRQFSLEAGDIVKISISGVGILDNPIARLPNLSEGLPPIDFPGVSSKDS